jgi:hypothetical protein
MKSVVGLLVIIILLAGAYYMLGDSTLGEHAKSAGVSSYKDLTYKVEGQPVQLRDGFAESESAPGSASKTVTRIFGNEATGDLDGDGVDDIGFLITQEGGGSGLFYYAAAALRKGDGFVSVDATIIGDRIAPQTTEIRNGQLIVNYADRAPGEPMTVQPSVGKSLYLRLDPKLMQFGEVVQDFEGEADTPSGR